MPPEPSDDRGFDRVADALRWGEARLQREGIEGGRLQATLLLGDVMGLDRAQVLARLAEPVPETAAAEYRDRVTRRAGHEPLQYIRRLAHFLDFELEVHRGVFIPRPETEQVVERALQVWGTGSWAVDVGTGSGAIALALARARTGGRIVALDRSPEALETALRNAERLAVCNRILLIRGDLLAPLGAAEGPAPEGVRRAVGLVVSNPPYAAADAEVMVEVRDHEPTEAWAAGVSGTEVYERLIPQAADLLLPGRPLVLELGYDQETPVSALLADDGRWQPPAIEADFQGIPRVLTTFRQ